MPSPKSQITRLHETIASGSTFRTWSHAKIYLGARYMNFGSPPRVVIYPQDGVIRAARHKSKTIRDVDRQFVMHLWGSHFDELCELQSRVMQALDEQLPQSPADLQDGFFYKSIREDWNVVTDTAKQGEEMQMTIEVYQSIEKVPFDHGRVDEVEFVNES